MDNSQSSDIYSDTNVKFRDVSTIDLQSYEEMVSKIKSNASTDFSAKTSKPLDEFSSLLDDCSSCVFQGLDILVVLLEDSSPPMDKLCLYLEETICIIQIISNSIKTIIESMAVTFSAMKTFSTKTGTVILSVFVHCKDSECIYESHLKTVERQLKDLFRSCHELQLTYLMTLEKYYMFDLTETEQQDILIETLDINLKIGELVQGLDVKTMAEQWKAYTMICDKYSSFLLDKDMFNKTSKLLVDITHNNIKISFEIGEDKVMIRSLKVASFCLKILLRICKIFKGANSNDYEHIVELLQQILLYSSSYHEVTKIPSNIINITNTHLLVPSETIITHLVTEENFINYITSRIISCLEDLRLLQYILLLLSVMKASVTHQDINEIHLKIIHLVMSVLPHCHTYFNNPKFTYKNMDKNHGLFENLLIQTLAVSSSLDNQHYTYLEKSLYLAILDTDYYCAAFSSNLWVLLCRLPNSQLHINTLICLIETYQKLATNPLFLFSPQHVHLGYTMENLFKTMKYLDKLNIYKQYSVYEEKNDGIWCILKLRNLPENLQMSAKKVVTQKVISLLELLSKSQFNEHLQDMIKVIKLASTFEFIDSDSRIESLLVQGWCKVCPKANGINLQTDLDVHTVFYFRYLEALTSLTLSYYTKMEDSSNIVKIVHIISNTLQLGNIEIIRLLFKIFCKLIIFQKVNSFKEIITETFKYLLERDDIELYIYSVIISNEEFIIFFTQMLIKENLKEYLNNFTEYKSTDTNEWQQRLQLTADNRYSHKCIHTFDVTEQSDMAINEDSNFEFVDLESSLEIENGSPPLNKKPKLDTNIESILDTLELDVLQLCRVKKYIQSEDYRIRIRNVCEKLKKIL